ncbi:MAG: 50S ribosomal protein L4 [Deltaproteobacteria bacterium]|nr:50S ribosomal protein L4 [Deltaproteobacteria bacterium]MBW1923221.1 50S ribosomal protein L4 [Deltaproteobacteria bacterium]MBW1949583.1 50S ribosomal protein L4 [Deltaproteobacteria bacterium]MBW2007444.1 50S ribosomal protein L4 [Deltaproteobacteria bacterium]MBW2102445.1 50S ribosomal protein L4 [Deltaproteobacteria bacterium]
MTVLDVYNLQREKTAEVELDDRIFGVQVKKHVLHQVIVSQRNKRRAGTSAVKTRSQVRSSGTKLWRQKGTGRARVGTPASPTRRGGGVAFGPVPRDYSTKVSKKVRKAAVRMALTDKVRNNQLVVIDRFDLPDHKTKGFVQVMNNFDFHKVLIVTSDANENLDRSSRNVPWVKVMRCEGLNVYDILKYDYLCLEQPTIEKIQEALVS